MTEVYMPRPGRFLGMTTNIGSNKRTAEGSYQDGGV